MAQNLESFELGRQSDGAVDSQVAECVYLTCLYRGLLHFIMTRVNLALFKGNGRTKITFSGNFKSRQIAPNTARTASHCFSVLQLFTVQPTHFSLHPFVNTGLETANKSKCLPYFIYHDQFSAIGNRS